MTREGLSRSRGIVLEACTGLDRVLQPGSMGTNEGLLQVMSRIREDPALETRLLSAQNAWGPGSDYPRSRELVPEVCIGLDRVPLQSAGKQKLSWGRVSLRRAGWNNEKQRLVYTADRHRQPEDRRALDPSRDARPSDNQASGWPLVGPVRRIRPPPHLRIHPSDPGFRATPISPYSTVSMRMSLLRTSRPVALYDGWSRGQVHEFVLRPQGVSWPNQPPLDEAV
jgi:hypothetical protein